MPKERDLPWWHTQLASNIRRARKQAGLTQAELASALDSEKNTVSRYERGDRLPSLEVIYQIADVLSVQGHDLFPNQPPTFRGTISAALKVTCSFDEDLVPDHLQNMATLIKSQKVKEHFEEHRQTFAKHPDSFEVTVEPLEGNVFHVRETWSFVVRASLVDEAQKHVERVWLARLFPSPLQVLEFLQDGEIAFEYKR